MMQKWELNNFHLSLAVHQYHVVAVPSWVKLMSLHENELGEMVGSSE